MKRLTSASNPESGTVCYGTLSGGNCQANGYDANGNLVYKTDARSVLTTYGYDALNRTISRTYSDGTPTVSYVYDPATNGKGRLTSVSSNVSAYGYGSYDALGRATSVSQTIYGQPNQTYTIGYSYDLAGHVVTETYPSQHAVTYNYDTAGRLADKDSQNLAFTGNLGDGTTRTYSRGIAYTSRGGMSQEQFGTTPAIYNKLLYNVRGQLAEIRESTTGGDTSWNRGAIINHYSNNYGCWGASCNAPDNNGNLMKQDVYIPGDDQISSYTMRWQQYSYDNLNRLTQVYEHTSADWQQNYSYDRYGNRTVGTDTTGLPAHNYSISRATNKLYGPGETDATHSLIDYDAAGNQKKDNYSDNALGKYYEHTFDAENRMNSSTTTFSDNSTQVSTYSYDGDGRRVKRNIGTVETWQVYGLGGELIAEYAANASYTTPQKEYGYRNGQMLIEANVPAGAGGSAPSFADDPLNPNGTHTEIQLIHLTQLRTAVNDLRARAGLSAASFSQDPNPTQYVTEVHHAHIMQLRQALEPALAALHLPTVPAGGYAHGDRHTGDSIYAIDFQELRNEIKMAYACKINWLVADQLGTPRIIFDASGSLATTSRHDYLPFGEELFAGTGGRTQAQGYSVADGVRQKFTQKERDNETGLDYSIARYYASTQGRFTSPDPFMGSGRTAVPQSWNRYVYCANSPLVLVDPTGLDWGSYDLGNGERSYVWFEGKVGKYKGRQYSTVDFGKSSSKVLTLVGGSQVEIFKNGASNPLTQMAARSSQGQRANQTQDDSLPEANQAVIRQVAAQPFEKATAAFALGSAMQGSTIAFSSILLLDSIAATALILHDADHQDGGSNVAATTGRAREVSGGEISEANVPDAALRYLGSGYKELSPGRYVSADGMRQIRFGAHETRGPLHIHFEVYEKSFFNGGSVIENSRVSIVP